MSNTQDLYRLLRARNGQWVTRADLQFVGGLETGRRMRELQNQLIDTVRERLESRTGPDGRTLEYRLIELTPDEEKVEAQRLLWECVKCGQHPGSYATTQPSVDPRWRLGRCRRCGKNATFRRNPQ